MPMKKLIGTPAEIGSGIFIDALMPMIRQASEKMTANQLGELYLGFIGASFGSLEADFGKQVANMLVQKSADSYINGAAFSTETMQ